MSLHTCPGCGTEHHWLACPEVSQSVFEDEDPETAREELDDLMSDLSDPAYSDLLDPEVKRVMGRRVNELVAFLVCHEIALDYDTFETARRYTGK